jgi:hypothetical protein
MSSNVGSACRSGCPTRDHSSWGECARAARIGLDVFGHAYAARKDQAEIDRYRAADAAGLDPEAPTHAAVDAAERRAEHLDRARERFGVQ